MTVRWTALVPMKALPLAKSRLLAASTDTTQHARLVRAMRADTIAAITAANHVARVLVITDRFDDEHPEAIVQSRKGLNHALAEGAEFAQGRWPDDGVVAVVGDLPALRSNDLDAALRKAARYQRSFVADATQQGTTLLAAQPGVTLRPLFGTGSATQHAASKAHRLAAPPGLRCDVDTLDDLCRAAEVGLGTHTAQLAAELMPVTGEPAWC